MTFSEFSSVILPNTTLFPSNSGHAPPVMRKRLPFPFFRPRLTVDSSPASEWLRSLGSSSRSCSQPWMVILGLLLTPFVTKSPPSISFSLMILCRQVSLYPAGRPFQRYSPVQNCRKFQAVLGQTSWKSSKVSLPSFCLLAWRSKKTTGLSLLRRMPAISYNSFIQSVKEWQFFYGFEELRDESRSSWLRGEVLQLMGNSEAPIYNIQGEEIKNKKCIIIVTPPSYEIAKLVSKIPPEYEYEFISIGQMIRDEINKKTNYSKIIMDNLEKDKKINENILDILLKNASLLGNFIIRYAPIDEDEVAIWKKFINKANIQMTVIIRADVDDNVKKRPSFREKYEEYERDMKNIKNMVDKTKILEIDRNESAVDVIIKAIQEGSK